MLFEERTNRLSKLLFRSKKAIRNDIQLSEAITENGVAKGGGINRLTQRKGQTKARSDGRFAMSVPDSPGCVVTT
jgi:hypothetical protein